MRIFVTGATGVIGRRVVPLLVQAGHEVTAIGRSPAKREQLARAGATPVDVSLFDAAALRRVLPGHDAVVNLATRIPPSAASMFLPWAWRENDRIRTEGSATLAEAALAAGVGRLVQESFAPIYADGGDAWLDENAPVAPAAYNRSTLDAERNAARFTERGGTGVVLRYAYFYGPDAPHTREMLDMARRGWCPLPGAPDAFWSSIMLDDAAAATAAALAVPAGVYNVADDEPLRRGEWAAALARALGLPPLRFLPRWTTRLGGSSTQLVARSQRIANRALRQASGWAPRHPSARAGLAAVVAALRETAAA